MRYLSKFLMLITAVISLTACNQQPHMGKEQQALVNRQEAVAIQSAILQYVRQQTSVPAEEVIIHLQAREGNMIRVGLQTKHPIADPATAFIRHSANGWNVVVLGTSFDMNTYQQFQIPPSLWLQSPNA